MEWFKKFISNNHGIAIHDSFGMHDYKTFLLTTESYIQYFRSYQPDKILVSGGNHIYMLSTILALMDAGFEVILLDNKASNHETEILIDTYEIKYRIHICDAQSAFSFIGSKVESGCNSGKLYFFSSGSTGKPKLFAYNCQNLYDMMCTWSFPLNITASEKVYCPLPVTHNHGLVISLAAFMKGSQMIYNSSETFDINDTISLLEKEQPDIMTGTPHVYEKMIHCLPSNFNGFKKIRFAFCGSAPMNAELSTQYFNTLGKYLNQAYGLSEIGPTCIDMQPELGVGTVGRIFDGIEYKIINDKGEECSHGEEGELIMKAHYMCSEYLNNPEETMQTFRDGWLYTKDIVSKDIYNRIKITGRKSQFINISGYKVHPVEIENAIKSKFQGHIVAVKEQKIGNKQSIILYIERDLEDKIEDIKSFCNTHLSTFKRPSHFKVIDKIPLSSLGKVLYAQLPKI